MLKNYLITSLTFCENLKLIKPGVLNPDLALLFIPLCERRCRPSAFLAPRSLKISRGEEQVVQRLGRQCEGIMRLLCPPRVNKFILFLEAD